MPKGYREDGTFAGKMFQKGHKYQTGSKNSSWKGGKRKYKGYIKLLKPKHPLCDCNGYVFEHRLVMEKHLRRYLRPEERIHHINHLKDDNRIENLMLFPNTSTHRKAHKKIRHT